jgi:cation diffusion facilitator CzcD-associated flavoprotein CzcO
VTTGTEVDVAIVGAGFGGIGMAAELRRHGRSSFVVLEQADDIGGTWRDNTYPGAACDIPSHLYSYSFMPEGWPRRYSDQRAILGYLRRVADRYGLWPDIRTGCAVERLAWDDSAARWRVHVAGGEVMSARVVVGALGQLNKPALPATMRVERFAGPWWHSARWDHSVDLTGKRVGVVGTGASAIQFVPEVARRAERTVVFQRSAPYVLPKADRAYGQQELSAYRLLPVLQRLDRLRVWLTGETLGLGLVGSRRWLAVLTRLWRVAMERQVPDPALRRACEPDYVMGCKRILFSNDWYPTLARPDVELVTEAVAEITERGVRTESGRRHELDVLIYGTGFDTTHFLMPMVVEGMGGHRLDERWRHGASAYLGVTVPGFPNLFLLYGPNTNLGSNSIIFMLESQFRYVLGALAAMDAEGIAAVDVRPEVARRFDEWVDATSRRTAWLSGCHSWYTTADGRNTNNWPSSTFVYRRRLARFDLAAYDARLADPVAESGPALAAG